MSRKIQAELPSRQRFEKWDEFLIVKDGSLIESQPTEERAKHACEALNAHEQLNGRPASYTYRVRGPGNA